MGQPVAALSSGRVGTLSGNGVVCDPKRQFHPDVNRPGAMPYDWGLLDTGQGGLRIGHLTALE